MKGRERKNTSLMATLPVCATLCAHYLNQKSFILCSCVHVANQAATWSARLFHIWSLVHKETQIYSTSNHCYLLSYFHLGSQTSTLPAAQRRAELELGVWRSEPLAFEGVRCTKAGALSNKLARPCRLNQRYGNWGIRAHVWPTFASDVEVFADFVCAFVCNKEHGQLAGG